MPLAVLSPSIPRLTCLGAGNGPWQMALWLLELGMEARKRQNKGPHFRVLGIQSVRRIKVVAWLLLLLLLLLIAAFCWVAFAYMDTYEIYALNVL